MYAMRTTKPSNNKYFIRLVTGGWNGCIQGDPTDPTANVLANCVGYANGRFNEIIGENKCPYQLTCNAENFIERAKQLGLKISSKPVLGGIMVWMYGATLSGSDGAGHVAIVEKIINENTIYTSESSYGGTYFFNATRRNTNGRWGMASGFTFRGCIVNPAVHEDEPTSDEVKASGVATNFDKKYDHEYVATDNLNVRDSGSINSKILGTIAKGTKVRCYGYYTHGSDYDWLYAIAEYNGVKYTGFFANAFLKVDAPDNTVKVGSKIRIKSSAMQYGKTIGFAPMVYRNVYTVSQINGDRVVFNSGNVVMGAVKLSDCIPQ